MSGGAISPSILQGLQAVVAQDQRLLTYVDRLRQEWSAERAALIESLNEARHRAHVAEHALVEERTLKQVPTHAIANQRAQGQVPEQTFEAEQKRKQELALALEEEKRRTSIAFEQYQAVKASYDAKLATAGANLQQLSGTIRQMEAASAEQSRKIEALQHELSQTKEENTLIKRQLNTVDTDAKASADENRKLRAQLDSVSNTLALLREAKEKGDSKGAKVVASMMTNANNLKAKNADLESDLRRRNTDLANKHEENAKIASELTTIQQKAHECTQRLAHLQPAHDDLVATLTETKERLKTSTEERDRLSKQVKELHNRSVEWKGVVAKLVQSTRQKDVALDGLRHQVEDLESKRTTDGVALKRLSQHVHELSTENASLRTQLNTIKHAEMEKDTACHKFQNDLNTARSQLGQNETHLKEALARQNDIHSNLKSCQSQVDVSNRALQKANQQIKTQSTRLQAKDAALTNCKSQVTNCKSQVTDCKSQVVRLNKELKQAQAENQSLTTRLNQAMAEIGDNRAMKEQIEGCQAESKKSELARASMKADLDKAESARASMKVDLDEKLAELKSVKEKMDELTSTNKTLKTRIDKLATYINQLSDITDIMRYAHVMVHLLTQAASDIWHIRTKKSPELMEMAIRNDLDKHVNAMPKPTSNPTLFSVHCQDANSTQMPLKNCVMSTLQNFVEEWNKSLDPKINQNPFIASKVTLGKLHRIFKEYGDHVDSALQTTQPETRQQPPSRGGGSCILSPLPSPRFRVRLKYSGH